jgi:hypothetical protein
MEAVQTARHPQDATPPNFDTVWAALMENREQLKETDRIVKENARQIGKLSDRMGEVVEYMVVPNLREKFRELGYDFPQAHQNSDVSDPKNKIFLEIDVKLENGDKVMLVEVKTKPTTKDVKDHIKRLEKMRVYADLHGDKRTFLGAVAGAVMTDNVKEYTLKQGFFVIEPSRGEPSPLCGSVEDTGETFNIISPNGKPKEW